MNSAVATLLLVIPFLIAIALMVTAEDTKIGSV